MAWSTVEVRWVFAGPLAKTGPGMAAWFSGRPALGTGGAASGGRATAPIEWQPKPPRWRRDRYLLLPGEGDMGIKWREGRLEIKGRVADLGCLRLAPGIEGRCERWLKWSYAGNALERGVPLPFRKGAAGIVTVEKRRMKRCLRFDPGRDPVEVGPDEPRLRGIDVELARIRLERPAARTHWSLAFEAFPDAPDVAVALTAVVPAFLDRCPALPLAAADSMSYPQWLSATAESPSADDRRQGRDRRGAGAR